MTLPRAGTQIVLTTCPRDCYDSCGIAVIKRDERVIAVRGNPGHPVNRGALCGKCSTAYNREWRDPARRLTQPLRRVGAKGGGGFEAVSWDTAIGEIAESLQDTVARHGAGSILNVHYTGTLSLLAGMAPMRFFNRLGATEVVPDTICNMAGHVALRHLYGTSLNGFDPRTAASAACILVWGANPHASAPHAHEHWLPEAPGTVVVIDPVRTPTAARADIHLQPHPGSDAVLAFGMLHVMQREQLLDTAFIAAHVEGWDELAAPVAACSVAWASAVTGVPVARIEEVARLYARGPSLLWLGQGLQRQAFGGNVMRTCAVLPAVTGNLGKPGAGFVYLNGDLRQRGIDEAYLTAPQLAPAGQTSISHMDLVDALESPARSRALIIWNMNPVASCPQQTRLRRALARPDLLTVALDLFPTDSTALADYVLPAASFLEFDDLIASYFHLTLSVQRKVMEPCGAALPNQEIFRRLARAMRFEDPQLRETDAAILEALLGRSGLGETFESLAAKGTMWVPAQPAVQFEDLAFATPSGRIEVASAAAEEAGLPRVPVCRSDPRPDDGRLRLLTPAHAWLLNTSFGNVQRIGRRLGPATVALNAADAAQRQLADGDRVWVESECGRLDLEVTVTDDLPPGVALAHKGRWLGEGANVNVLNAGHKSDMGESSAVHSMMVRVQRRDPPAAAAP